jgi:hypothetical protein
LKRERKRVWFQSIKKQYHCIVCKTNDFRVLDFHHRDPKEKDIEVSSLIRKGNKNKMGITF